MKSFWIAIALLAVLTIVIWLPSRNAAERMVPGQRIRDDALPVAGTQPATTLKPDDVAMLVKDLEASYNARLAQPDATPAATAPAGTSTATVIHKPATMTPAADKPGAAPGAMITSETGPKIEYRADGSMLIDDRFTVRGDGTAHDPYRITWEYLVSAQETYTPRLDMYEMPARISMLDGKHVQISGYVFVPMYRSETTEMMVMRNMWDGCCIGVPPTSYDAIEVKLKQPLSMKDRRFATTGMLTGTLKVDPYVQGSWLLGLYLVEDGTVDFEL